MRAFIVVCLCFLTIGCAATGDAGRTTQDDTPSRAPAKTYPEPVYSIKKVASPPENTKTVRPTYSFEMMQAQAQGRVLANVLVGSDGSVLDVEIIEDIGHNSDEITRAALRQYTYTPARLEDGTPVAVWIEVTVNYYLPR